MFSFNPASGVLTGVANCGTDTGAQSRGALVEAADGFLYGTTSLYGDSARDYGSTFRVIPALRQ